MEVIADLHLHSKYSRAVSQEMNLENTSRWAKKKGIGLIATGDFTYPEWFSEIRRKLVPQGNGFFQLQENDSGVSFILGTEISCIYSKNGRGHRIHTLVFFPTIEAVEKFNAHLSWTSNLKSDGRPIIGMDVKELAKIAFDISNQTIFVPAHAWTPWFSLFGSMSGFDRIQDCFEELTSRITAIETGLSSDPSMNWRLSQLDDISIISFSDAHSLPNIGREATIFELENLSYENLVKALKRPTDSKNTIVSTIEFFPEEGKYHWDGHRNCNIRFSPEETKKATGICPVCHRRVTVGVMNRVDELADRPPMSEPPSSRPPYRSLVPLQEIIAEALGQKKGTKAVDEEYERLIKRGGGEFHALLNRPYEELQSLTLPRVAEGIMNVRRGEVTVEPGYDGVYGVVKVFPPMESTGTVGQQSLF